MTTRCAEERGADGLAAVFLDRDGTLIADKPYRADPDEIELLPGVTGALSLLQDAGYLLIVITNQSGIARGYFDEPALARMHRRLDELLAERGASVAAYYFCPHHTDGVDPRLAKECVCRKPAPGMILRAARDWGIDLKRSWLIGDQITDCQAGMAAGCRSFLVGADRPESRFSLAPTLESAACSIIARDGRGPSPPVVESRSVRRR